MSYLVSKKSAAEFFVVSVQALDGWFTAGCPVAQRDAQGRITKVDLADMARWRIDRAAADSGGSDLDRERTRLTKAQADKTELEVAELRAELVRTPLIEQHWQGMVAAMRAKVVAIPSKVAPQVASPEDLNRVQELMQAVVFEALAEIAGDAFPDEVRKRLTLATDAINVDGGETAAETDGDAVGECAPAAQRRGQRGARAVPKR